MKVNEDSAYIKLVNIIKEYEIKSKEDIKYSAFAWAFRRMFPKKDYNELKLGELSYIVPDLPPFTREQMNMKIKDIVSKRYVKTLIKRQMGLC